MVEIVFDIKYPTVDEIVDMVNETSIYHMFDYIQSLPDDLRYDVKLKLALNDSKELDKSSKGFYYHR